MKYFFSGGRRGSLDLQNPAFSYSIWQERQINSIWSMKGVQSKRNAIGQALECSMETLRKSSLLSVSEEHGPKELLSTQSLINPLLWPVSSKTWWLILLYPVVVSWTVRSWWATEKPHKVPLMLRKMVKMSFLSKTSDGLQSLHAVRCYCCASMSPQSHFYCL